VPLVISAAADQPSEVTVAFERLYVRHVLQERRTVQLEMAVAGVAGHRRRPVFAGPRRPRRPDLMR
jgi:hypothetical protein